MPVAAGKTVNVLGDAKSNSEDESLHQHKTFPTPEETELRNTANLIFSMVAPDAVNASPIADIVNFICLAEVFTHSPVEGTKALPPATYPPAAATCPFTEEFILNVNVDALLALVCSCI